MPSLPVDGQTNWGDTLNAYLADLSSTATGTQTALNGHASNSPADPHGDRAYTQSIVNPIINGVNAANGYVKANSSGSIPANLIYSNVTGGMFNKIYDAVAMYGATAGTGSDQSVKINNAISDAAAAGGGIVYLGPGVFSISSTLVMKNKTWLLMTPGTILRRIQGSPNAPIMISNIALNSGGTPATNIMITGGTIDMYGTAPVTSACEGIFLFRTFNAVIRDTYFISPYNAGPAIEINASSGVHIDGCQFTGISGATIGNFPVFRLNTASTSTTIAGLNPAYYDNTACFSINISNNIVGSELTFNTTATSPYGYFAGSDLQSVGAPGHQVITLVGNTCYYTSSAGGNRGEPVQNNNNWATFTMSGNSFLDITPHDWAVPSLSNGFTSGTQFPFQYRIIDDGYMHIYGSLKLPSSYNNVTVIMLPRTPAHTVVAPILYKEATAPTAMPCLQITTTGVMTLGNLPAGLNGDNVYIDTVFPITGSRIQT